MLMNKRSSHSVVMNSLLSILPNSTWDKAAKIDSTPRPLIITDAFSKARPKTYHLQMLMMSFLKSLLELVKKKLLTMMSYKEKPKLPHSTKREQASNKIGRSKMSSRKVRAQPTWVSPCPTYKTPLPKQLLLSPKSQRKWVPSHMRNPRLVPQQLET